MPKKSRTKTKGKPTTITPHAALLGTMPDAEIAALAGVSKEAVAQYRARRKIPAFSPGGARPGPASPTPAGEAAASKTTPAPPLKPVAAKGKSKPVAKAKPTVVAATPSKATSKETSSKRPKTHSPAEKILARRLDIVGVLDDHAVARIVGMSHETVRRFRVRNEIPSATAMAAGVEAGTSPAAKNATAATKTKIAKKSTANKAAPKTPAATAKATSKKKGTKKKRVKRKSKLDAHLAIVGVLTDAEVGKREGVTREGVRQFRWKHGIASSVVNAAQAGSTAASSTPKATSSKATASKAGKAPASVATTLSKKAKASTPKPVAAKPKAPAKKPSASLPRKAIPSASAPAPAAKPAPSPATASRLVKARASGGGAAGKTTCWRISLREGEHVFVVADSLALAAQIAGRVLGDSATGVEWHGAAIR